MASLGLRRVADGHPFLAKADRGNLFL